MNTRTLRITFFLGPLLLLPLPGLAADEDEAMAASECPRLFGTPRIHERNRDLREKRIHWLEHDDRYEIAHSVQWKRPAPITFPGVTIIEIDDERLVVEIDDRFEPLDCEPGRYEVPVDAAFGAGNRVIGLFSGVALIEIGRTLSWIAAPGVERPRWRMIWGSPYYFTARSRASTGGGRRGAKARRNRNRRNNRRRR